jgi:hypothetical protein
MMHGEPAANNQDHQRVKKSTSRSKSKHVKFHVSRLAGWLTATRKLGDLMDCEPLEVRVAPPAFIRWRRPPKTAQDRRIFNL